MYKNADEEQHCAMWHSFDLQIKYGGQFLIILCELLIILDQWNGFLSACLNFHSFQKMQV